MELHSILNTQQKGYYYINRTGKYLAPSLSLYGEVFMQNFLKLKVMSYGLDDISLPQDESYERPIFILCEKNIAFNYAMQYLGEHFSYIDSYYFGDIKNTTYVMLVLNLHRDMKESYELFIKGRYSKMYGLINVENINFNNKYSISDVKDRTEGGKTYFKELIKQHFDTVVSDDDITDAEYDLPFEMEEEVYNYKLKKL